MKKLTTEEMMNLLPKAPVEGETGPYTTRLPRQCPTCDAEHEVVSLKPVQNPTLRFELCPKCWLAEEQERQEELDRQIGRAERLEDLPEVEPPHEEREWYP